jgi:hypothetical protein
MSIFDPAAVGTVRESPSSMEKKNPLDRLEPTAVKQGNELDPRTIRV